MRSTETKKRTSDTRDPMTNPKFHYPPPKRKSGDMIEWDLEDTVTELIWRQVEDLRKAGFTTPAIIEAWKVVNRRVNLRLHRDVRKGIR